jgi:hypothetical protein
MSDVRQCKARQGKGNMGRGMGDRKEGQVHLSRSLDVCVCVFGTPLRYGRTSQMEGVHHKLSFRFSNNAWFSLADLMAGQ